MSMQAVEETVVERAAPTALRPAPSLAVSTDPMMMVAQAVASGAPMEIVRELIAMRDRYAAEAKKDAFNEAMVKVKAELKPVVKNKHVQFPAKSGGKDTDYWHEDLSAVCEAIDAAAPKHGISYRWNTITELNKPVIVQCIVSGHGHEFMVEQSGGRDDSGNKNALQSQSSALTYLKRDTLKSAFGLASKDDDARASGQSAPTVSEEQVREISDLLTSTKSNLSLFLKKIKLESLAEIRADKFDEVIALIKNTAEKRAARDAETKQ